MAFLQPFAEQAKTLPVEPKQFNQPATLNAKGKQGAAEWIFFQHLLGQHRQSVHPLAHIRVAACQPDMRAGWRGWLKVPPA
jgi:hypothetical protein